MQHEAVLARHHLDPVDAGVELLRPEAGIADHHRHGRQHLEVLLVDEGELRFVHRIVAETDAERVEHAVLSDRSSARPREFSARAACRRRWAWIALPSQLTQSSPAGLTRGSIFYRKKMECRVKPGNDAENAQRCPSHRIPGEHVGRALERRERGAERALELLRRASPASSRRSGGCVRIGRGWLNRNISLLRTPKICPEMPSARSEPR